jgi:hypothetical protein
MICDKCIHQNACISIYASLGRFSNAETINCVNFEDKKYYQKFPCEIGDTIYKVNIKGCYESGWKPYIEELKITEISKKFNRSGKDIGWALICGANRYKLSNIGNILFLSKKNAETKLKEIMGK